MVIIYFKQNNFYFIIYNFQFKTYELDILFKTKFWYNFSFLKKEKVSWFEYLSRIYKLVILFKAKI